MLEQQAIVTKVDGSQVHIRSLQTSACSHCHEQSSCGTALYAKALPGKELILPSPVSVKVGDKVIVGIQEQHLVLASVLTYLLPLLVMLFTVGLYDGSDQMTVLLAIASLAIAFFIIQRLQYLFIRRILSPPVILRKC